MSTLLLAPLPLMGPAAKHCHPTPTAKFAGCMHELQSMSCSAMQVSLSFQEHGTSYAADTFVVFHPGEKAQCLISTWPTFAIGESGQSSATVGTKRLAQHALLHSVMLVLHCRLTRCCAGLTSVASGVHSFALAAAMRCKTPSPSSPQSNTCKCSAHQALCTEIFLFFYCNVSIIKLIQFLYCNTHEPPKSVVLDHRY